MTKFPQDWRDEAARERWIPEEREFTFGDVLRAATPAQLNEASLGRVWQHWRKGAGPDGSFALMISWRSDRDEEENQKLLAQFRGRLRAEGLGFFPLDGYGQEEDGQGGMKVAVEPSLFIPRIPLARALAYAREYGQFGIV